MAGKPVERGEGGHYINCAAGRYRLFYSGRVPLCPWRNRKRVSGRRANRIAIPTFGKRIKGCMRYRSLKLKPGASRALLPIPWRHPIALRLSGAATGSRRLHACSSRYRISPSMLEQSSLPKVGDAASHSLKLKRLKCHSSPDMQH